MDTPFLVWSGIIAVVAILFIIDAVKAFRRTHAEGGRHLLDMSKEREIFYIPGDPSPRRVDDDAYDFDDFEDL